MADTNNTITDENIDTKVIDTVVDESKVENTKVDVKTFTQEEVNTMITKRLEREKKNTEAEKVEAERLAKMSEGERLQAMFDTEKASFAEEKKQYQIERLELQVIKELSTKSLPTEFSKYLIGVDAETCMNNIKEFETRWSQAIANAVDGKLKGTTPKIGGGTSGVTKEQFNKMGYRDKQKLFDETPELYKELSK